MSPSLKICAAGLVAAVQVAMVAGCSSSKSSTAPTAPGLTLSTTVRVSNVLTGSAVAGASVSGGGLTGGTTGSSGTVSITGSSVSSVAVDVSSAGYVTRNTVIKFPGADADVNLIANDFNLTAFNQMFRVDALQRWTSQPPLAIMTSVLAYDEGTKTYTATAEQLSSAEMDSITADLRIGLPLMTAGVFQDFASVTQLPAVSAGSAVSMATDGRITYGRCTGLSSAGIGQWLFRSDNVVTGGVLCIDRLTDLGDPNLRRGVRIHELGHSLGAQHVDPAVRVSIMNPVISSSWEFNDGDRAAAKVAFARAPGNRTPDRDPSGFSTNSLVTRLLTADGCRVRR